MSTALTLNSSTNSPFIALPALTSLGSLDAYINSVHQYPMLSAEREQQLARGLREDNNLDSARELVLSHLRFVVHVARGYAGYGLGVNDLIQEGNIGLMKAVSRFDPEKGGKLSTYAAWWIKQSIKRGLANQSKTIRLPVHMVDKIAKMRRIATILTEALGREPTDEELADEVGLPHRKLALLRQASYRPASLDAPINEGEATEFGEVIRDDRAVNPLDMLSDKNLHGELDGLLSILDDRERRIIDERFGLGGHQALTLEEVGREFGVTRERIRQLQNSALAKMRRALRKKEKPIPKPLMGDFAIA